MPRAKVSKKKKDLDNEENLDNAESAENIDVAVEEPKEEPKQEPPKKVLPAKAADEGWYEAAASGIVYVGPKGKPFIYVIEDGKRIMVRPYRAGGN